MTCIYVYVFNLSMGEAISVNCDSSLLCLFKKKFKCFEMSLVLFNYYQGFSVNIIVLNVHV